LVGKCLRPKNDFLLFYCLSPFFVPLFLAFFIATTNQLIGCSGLSQQGDQMSL
jgi:hypothetical protein